MDFKGIIELMKAMNGSDLTKLEIEENNVSIKMEKVNNNISVQTNSDNKGNVSYIEDVNPPQKPQPPVQKNTVEVDQKETEQTNQIEDDADMEVVTSPIVGTFYAAPAPDKDNYVKVGSKVEAGDVLCIVEAMKIMNEIESEISGEVVEILGKNGEMVEYGQELFKIKKS